MRPVNLIPREQRRGKGASGGRNLGVYAVVGALVLVLVAVSAITLFDKKTSDRQAEVDSLQSQVDAAEAEASSFTSFQSFQQVHDARMATIDSLAKSRFDWERVMRELSIVIPDRVYLTNLTGTASPAVTVTGGAGTALRPTIPGPALELTGCAKNQRTVARLIAAMHDIDGVGRVLVSNSAKGVPSEDAATDDTGASAGGSAAPAPGGCTSRPAYPQFQLVAALDGVPIAAPVTAPTTVPTSATTAPATATTSTTATTPAPSDTAAADASATTTDGGVTAAAGSTTQQQNDVADAQASATEAAQIPSGGGK
jgi:Tfp pilus assembly protein PilN